MIPISKIKLAVASEYGIPIALMRDKTRVRGAVYPRMVAMALARELTPHSLPEIGKHFDRDHTTVLSGIRRVNAIPELRNSADKIAAELGAVEAPDWRKNFGLQFVAAKWIGDGLRGFA